jgi:hypothetical protein
MAFVVYAVSTRLKMYKWIYEEYHEHDGGSRGEHVFPANGAVAFEVSFYAFVSSL